MAVTDPLFKLKTTLSAEAAQGRGHARMPAGPQVQLSEQAMAVVAQLSDRPVSRTLFLGALRLVELLAIILLGFASLWWNAGLDEVTTMVHLAEVIGGGVLAILYIQAFEGYSTPAMRTFFQQFGRVVASWTMMFASLLTITILIGRGQIIGSPWISGWFATGVAALALSRIAVWRLIASWKKDGRLERRAVIVGGGRAAEDLIRSLEFQPDNDIRICGIFDDRGGERSPDVVAGYPKLGNIEELVAFGRLTRIDMLIVTVPMSAENRILDLMKKLWVLPVDIRLSAHTNKLKFRPRSYSYLGAVPLIDVMDKPLADWDSVAKRAFDLFFSCLILVIVSPAMLATAIAIKATSRGPVFFRQKRYGFNNELIEIWKFRSMFTDMTDADAARLVTKGDPRVTPIGRFIRKTSIDELPQLFNVILGTLSLVGPRPHALSAKAENELYEKVVDGYFARHKVKPGVTGWAQISGWRGETDTSEKIQKRVEHDLYYIENWSVWLDFVILVRTPFSLFNTSNAY